MSRFSFVGNIPASKSMLNRALNVQSYFPDLKITGDSNCDDVRVMKSAIVAFIKKSPEIQCGEAGTVLRFMAFRCSREPGNYMLKGSSRLLERPHSEIAYILDQLGVQVHLSKTFIQIISSGWKRPMFPIRIHRETSSQFASAFLLNSWNLNFDLEFEMKKGVSEAYWEMTQKMLEGLGLELQKKGDTWKVFKGQEVKHKIIHCEPDLSSAFSLAAAAALNGKCELKNWTSESLQPDKKFIELFKQAEVRFKIQNDSLIVEKSILKPIDADLADCPDLFPVLSVLMCYADGTSTLRGAPHLKFKESDRILKTKSLLEKAGIHCEQYSDGIRIYGRGEHFQSQAFEFDPDHDHRMAMAAAMFKLKDANIKILHPEVVTKSFPEFWQIIGITP